MTSLTAWTPHAVADRLPDQTQALVALGTLRGDTHPVRMDDTTIAGMLYSYAALAGVEEHEGVYACRQDFMPTDPKALLTTRHGKVLVFPDNSAFGMRNHGQQVVLPNCVFLLDPHEAWTQALATTAMTSLWTPALGVPKTVIGWRSPPSGLEMAFPIPFRVIQKRQAALTTLVDMLWDPTTDRPALGATYQAYDATSPTLVHANTTVPISTKGQPILHRNLGLITSLAKDLFPGRFGCPQVWTRTGWDHDQPTLQRLPFAYLEPYEAPVSAHARLHHQHDLHGRRMAQVAKQWPEVHARFLRERVA